MKKRITNIISALLILILLPASSGISIYHHICGLDGEHNISLFSESKCHHERPCCTTCDEEVKDQTDGTNLHCDYTEDCSSFVNFLHFDNEYLVINVDKNVTDDKELITEFLPVNHKMCNVNEISASLTEYLDFKLQINQTIIFIRQSSSSKADNDISIA